MPYTLSYVAIIHVSMNKAYYFPLVFPFKLAFDDIHRFGSTCTSEIEGRLLK